MGVRLMPRRSASAFSRMRWPGRNAPEAISWRMSAYTLSAMESARRAGVAIGTEETDISTYQSVSTGDHDLLGVDAGAKQPSLRIQDDGHRRRRDEVRHGLFRAERVQKASGLERWQDLRRDPAPHVDAGRRHHPQRDVARLGAVS